MINKVVKISLASLLFVLSANSYAEDNGAPVGNFEFAIQKTSYNYWGNTYTPWKGFRFATSVSNAVGDSNAVQVDFKAFDTYDKGDNGEYPVFGMSGTVHYIWKMESYDLGVFSGLHAGNGFYDYGTDMNLFLGGEARTDLTDSVSLHGQLGLLKNKKSYYPYAGNIKFGQAVLTGFVTDDFKLEASLGAIMGALGDDSNEKANTRIMGLRAEYGFLKSLSAFADVSFTKDSGYWSDSDYNTKTAAIGVNYAFGAGSLKARHDKGSSMKPMNFDVISWLRMDGY